MGAMKKIPLRHTFLLPLAMLVGFGPTAAAVQDKSATPPIDREAPTRFETASFGLG
jgi:hypothetical protein